MGSDEQRETPARGSVVYVIVDECVLPEGDVPKELDEHDHELSEDDGLLDHWINYNAKTRKFVDVMIVVHDGDAPYEFPPVPAGMERTVTQFET
ncbi:MAG: hypothetical protein KGL39_26810 [Patescibacteria group bacterium]|nr:hypothetical protein [Patescibacteria group bacterium]